VVVLIPPLYHLPEDSPLWEELAAVTSPVLLLSSLYPRPAEWLWRRHGLAGDVTAMRWEETVEETFAAIAGALVASDDTGEVRELDDTTDARWYPVVDRARCTNCHHCLQFCLFGVYAEDQNGAVQVANPDGCKPGCPACSRICPHGAIIFPLYAKDAAIAGAPGLVMAPDAAARKMYYGRTNAPCPVCGNTGTPVSGATTTCTECGRPVASPVYDEIDALIDELDDLARRSN
jgi:Pyruvate/2-oxoacid:ferredoxin oxidoreductase delta subunit